MGAFARGDVIIASLSYSDFSASKRRPALVVAVPGGLDPVLCLLTSKARGRRLRRANLLGRLCQRGFEQG